MKPVPVTPDTGTMQIILRTIIVVVLLVTGLYLAGAPGRDTTSWAVAGSASATVR